MPCRQRCVRTHSRNWILSGTFSQCSSREVELCVLTSSLRRQVERQRSTRTADAAAVHQIHQSTLNNSSHLNHTRSIIIIIIIIPSIGVPSASTRQLLSNLGRRLADISGESRETSYLFQRCLVLVQRFNAVQLHEHCSLPDRDCTDC